MPVTGIVAITAGVLAYGLALAYLLAAPPRHDGHAVARAFADPRVVVAASLPVPAFVAFLAARAALLAG